MERFNETLMKTECHFNWNLHELKSSQISLKVDEKLRDKIEELKTAGEFNRDECWPLLLTYGYELFNSVIEESFKIVEDVIQHLTATGNETSEYSMAHLHIAYSLKCFMLLKNDSDGAVVEELIGKIKSVNDMSDVERSGLIARKGQMHEFYWPGGISRAIPLLREAIQLNPYETQWKYSLVVCLSRKRHLDPLDITWADIEEPVNLLEGLLNDVELTPPKMVNYKYMLALAYRDYVRFKNFSSPEVSDCSKQIRRLCEEIHDKTDRSTVVSFCSQQLYYSNKSRGIAMIERVLEKFPDNVGVNTMAADLYRKERRYSLAAKYSQIAMDRGGYGAAWTLLECKVALQEQFDDEQMFDLVLNKFPKHNKLRTLLNISLYYFYLKGNLLKAAKFLGELIDVDPTYGPLKSTFCTWNYRKVCLLDDLCRRIAVELKENLSEDDRSTLSTIKAKIDLCSDVKTDSEREEGSGSPQHPRPPREQTRNWQRTERFGETSRMRGNFRWNRPHVNYSQKRQPQHHGKRKYHGYSFHKDSENDK